MVRTVKVKGNSKTAVIELRRCKRDPKEKVTNSGTELKKEKTPPILKRRDP